MQFEQVSAPDSKCQMPATLVFPPFYGNFHRLFTYSWTIFTAPKKVFILGGCPYRFPTALSAF